MRRRRRRFTAGSSRAPNAPSAAFGEKKRSGLIIGTGVQSRCRSMRARSSSLINWTAPGVLRCASGVLCGRNVRFAAALMSAAQVFFQL